MHEEFAAVFNFRSDRVSFVEWDLPEDSTVHLTLPQYWRKVCQLKTVDKWRSAVQRNVDEALLKSTKFDQEVATDEDNHPKYQILEYIFDHVLDTRTFKKVGA